MIDNSEDDPGIKALKNLFPQVKVIFNSSNVGFAKANNQAAEIAQGDNLIFINTDTILYDQAINSMQNYFCSVI